MRTVKARIFSTKLLRKNYDVAKVGLGYKSNAFNFLKITCVCKGNPNTVTGICAICKQVVALYRADSEVFDPELFIFCKFIVRCRCKKRHRMNREGKTIFTVGSPANRAT